MDATELIKTVQSHLDARISVPVQVVIPDAEVANPKQAFRGNAV